jgi:hypothetical protein
MFNKPTSGLVEHLSLTSATKVVTMIIVNLVTPKGAAKHDILFNEPASEVGLLNI